MSFSPDNRLHLIMISGDGTSLPLSEEKKLGTMSRFFRIDCVNSVLVSLGLKGIFYIQSGSDGDNNLINGNDNSGSVLFLFNSNLSLVTGIIIQTVVS